MTITTWFQENMGSPTNLGSQATVSSLLNLYYCYYIAMYIKINSAIFTVKSWTNLRYSWRSDQLVNFQVLFVTLKTAKR